MEVLWFFFTPKNIKICLCVGHKVGMEMCYLNQSRNTIGQRGAVTRGQDKEWIQSGIILQRVSLGKA